MQCLREKMKVALPLREFATRGAGPKTILRKLDRSKDFAGCYVFLQQGQPIYVGISQGVIGRILDHLRGTDHYTATLAYKTAFEEQHHEMTRSEAMEDKCFMTAFDRAKQDLAEFDVAFIEIEDAVELYLFEVYAAMELRTKWNSFKTH
jgi:predicted GIY-YIG superfamily endonuclease